MTTASSHSDSDNNDSDNGSDTQDRRRNERRDDNPRAGVQARPSIAPLDNNARKERKIMRKSSVLTLPTLLRGNDLYYDRTVTLHRCILSAQLIRIITPSNLNEKIPWYAQKNGQRQASGQTNYDRLLFFRPVYDGINESAPMDAIFVVMQNSVSNASLFNRFPNARDNGGFTIGSILIFVNPKPIEKYMSGLPMIESQDQAILASPTVCTPIPFRNDLDGNEMKAFYVQGSSLDLRTMTFVDTKCSGLFCDRQNLSDGGKKACGCFSHKSSRSCVAMQMNILFSTQSGEIKLMEKFSSQQFFRFLTKGFLSIDIRSSQLQNGNDAYDDIIESVENIFELINEDGGWTITGWSKRGLINDAALISSNSSGSSGNASKENQNSSKVLSEEVTTHIVQIEPTKREYLDMRSLRGEDIQNKRFDISSL